MRRLHERNRDIGLDCGHGRDVADVKLVTKVIINIRIILHSSPAAQKRRALQVAVACISLASGYNKSTYCGVKGSRFESHCGQLLVYHNSHCELNRTELVLNMRRITNCQFSSVKVRAMRTDLDV